MKKQLGIHYIIEIIDGNALKLNDVGFLRALLLECAKKIQTEVTGVIEYVFPVQGVTIVVGLKESHISIHTFPEYNYAAVDVFTCNMKVDISFLPEYFKNNLDAKVKTRVIARGF